MVSLTSRYHYDTPRILIGLGHPVAIYTEKAGTYLYLPMPLVVLQCMHIIILYSQCGPPPPPT